MGSFSILHWIVVLVIVLIVFGTGKLPSAMGDLAKGVKAFRAGLKDDEPPVASHDPKFVGASSQASASPTAVPPASPTASVNAERHS
ncbi:Sec-independent protein translocase protein TatA [Azospirillaceae bacterium]